MSHSNPFGDRHEQAVEFQRLASQPRPGLLREMFQFLLHNKKWWLVPIVVALLALGFLIILSGTGLAPYVYVMF
jgi:hypothetical protein